jgi:homoserine dehydrogenase
VSEKAAAEIIVLKFGSSVLRTDADLPNAVHEIYRWVRRGYRIVAVVSAVGEATDQLLGLARGLSSTPESFATAELLATGERASAALLGIALDRAGVPARVLNPREIGLTVSGSPLDSELVSVDVERLRGLLAEHPVLVVPGFFGTDDAGRTHLLGRGGSDLSAVFLAHVLGARCRLIKDKWCVDRNVEQPPRSPQFPGQRAAELHITDAPYSASSQSRSERLGRHLDDAMELPPLAALANACLFISRSTFA